MDSPAINKAIEAAAAAGGGTVRLPAGDYLAASIRLQSNITFQLDKGSDTDRGDNGTRALDTAKTTPKPENMKTPGIVTGITA